MDATALTYIAVGTAQIITMLGGGGVVFFKLGRGTERIESAIVLQKQIAEQSTVAISELKTEIADLKNVLTEVALQKAAIERLEKWYDELRRGEGFIYPLGNHLATSPR